MGTASYLSLDARIRRLPLVFLALLTSCGGSGDPDPTPSATPSPIPSTIHVYSGTFLLDAAPFGAVIYKMQEVSLPSRGVVDVSVDWTFQSSNLDVLVTDQACDDRALVASQCAVLASDRSFAKPIALRYTETAARTIRVWVISFANVSESGVLDVYLTL